MSNIDTGQKLYEAFGRGYVSAILDKLDDPLEWETQPPVSTVPWLQSRRRKGQVPGFFESPAPMKITPLEPHTFFDGGDKIFVLIAFEATNQDWSYSFPNKGHLWQFNLAGKVTRYEHITDTAQVIRMANGESRNALSNI